jgi:hypothetical protein
MSMRRISLLLLLLTLVATTGCQLLARSTPQPAETDGGGQVAPPNPGGGGGAGGDPGGGGGVVDPDPDAPPDVVDGSQRVQPDPTVVDARPTAVDHLVIGPDGRTIVVFWWGGVQDCFGLHSITAEVRDGALAITVMEGTNADAVGDACVAMAQLKSAVVTLDEPIIVDGSGAQAEPGEPSLPPSPVLVDVADGVVPHPNPVAIAGYHLAGDGVTLTAFYYGGVEGCYALAEASAADDGGVLTITLREGQRPNAGACIEIAVAKAVTFTLSEALFVQDL